ncbi:hypothetical protein TNCV_866981 [Trichonephila clavipes]|nr:hypothetical protein TNCV_866981 [Trichonephila clavipes]
MYRYTLPQLPRGVKYNNQTRPLYLQVTQQTFPSSKKKNITKLLPKNADSEVPLDPIWKPSKNCEVQELRGGGIDKIKVPSSSAHIGAALSIVCRLLRRKLRGLPKGLGYHLKFLCLHLRSVAFLNAQIGHLG